MNVNEIYATAVAVNTTHGPADNHYIESLMRYSKLPSREANRNESPRLPEREHLTRVPALGPKTSPSNVVTHDMYA